MRKDTLNIYKIYWANGISQLGNIIYSFTLAWWMIQQTGDTKQFGILSTITLLPNLIFNLGGGVIADRVNKKHILILADFMAGIAVLCLTISSFINYSFMLIVITNMIISLARSFFPQLLRPSYQT
ncbi:MFS transporter [Rummeliibacillus suwonensis]|nr:MFS transporter [Rummeliibacillus suwonensis]MBO2535624.1 MFS transporter [Rummeliibacillus suwonensis]